MDSTTQGNAVRKPITLDINPETGYFIYVAPPPKITYEAAMRDPIREFRSKGTIVKGKLFDILTYPFDNISDFHSRWATGMPREDLRKLLLRKWPQAFPGSRVGFYLFEIIG